MFIWPPKWDEYIPVQLRVCSVHEQSTNHYLYFQTVQTPQQQQVAQLQQQIQQQQLQIQQQTQLNESQIKQSEQNLAAQFQSLMQQQQVIIDVLQSKGKVIYVFAGNIESYESKVKVTHVFW